MEDFPPLIVGRGTHACAGYEKRENGVDKIVSIILIFALQTMLDDDYESVGFAASLIKCVRIPTCYVLFSLQI